MCLQKSNHPSNIGHLLLPWKLKRQTQTKNENQNVYDRFEIHTNQTPGMRLPLCIAYVPLAVVIDGSHFDDPTPTPNAPSGPIARTDATKCAIVQITLNTNNGLILLPHFFTFSN